MIEVGSYRPICYSCCIFGSWDPLRGDDRERIRSTTARAPAHEIVIGEDQVLPAMAAEPAQQAADHARSPILGRLGFLLRSGPVAARSTDALVNHALMIAAALLLSVDMPTNPLQTRDTGAFQGRCPTGAAYLTKVYWLAMSRRALCAVLRPILPEHADSPDP